MAEPGEWNRKGAVLSDVTAKKEYGAVHETQASDNVSACCKTSSTARGS
jgi:hypothetical protein